LRTMRNLPAVLDASNRSHRSLCISHRKPDPAGNALAIQGASLIGTWTHTHAPAVFSQPVLLHWHREHARKRECRTTLNIRTQQMNSSQAKTSFDECTLVHATPSTGSTELSKSCSGRVRKGSSNCHKRTARNSFVA
jgi:hypothetical protein